jgi:hypothetical protein
VEEKMSKYRCKIPCRLLVSSTGEGNTFRNVKENAVESNVPPIARHFFVPLDKATENEDARDRNRIKKVLDGRGVAYPKNATTAQAAKLLARDNKAKGQALDSEVVDKKANEKVDEKKSA